MERPPSDVPPSPVPHEYLPHLLAKRYGVNPQSVREWWEADVLLEADIAEMESAVQRKRERELAYEKAKHASR